MFEPHHFESLVSPTTFKVAPLSLSILFLMLIGLTVVNPSQAYCRPAKLHAFGMKVPHFTCSLRTNFPYIFNKVMHFRFSCSPYISLKLRQLQLRFTHFTYSNLAAIRRVASQLFLVSPRDHFVGPVSSFSEMKEIG